MRRGRNLLRGHRQMTSCRARTADLYTPFLFHALHTFSVSHHSPKHTTTNNSRTSTENSLLTLKNYMVLPYSFIQTGYFYSASSSPLLLRSAPDTARILCQSFMPKCHRQLRVKDDHPVKRFQLYQCNTMSYNFSKQPKQF